jgi:hypothetical protein
MDGAASMASAVSAASAEVVQTQDELGALLHAAEAEVERLRDEHAIDHAIQAERDERRRCFGPFAWEDREQIAACLYMARWPHRTWITAGLDETAHAYRQADAIISLCAAQQSPDEVKDLVSDVERHQRNLALTERSIDQMQHTLEKIRDEAATESGAWAAGIATLCLATLMKGTT